MAPRRPPQPDDLHEWLSFEDPEEDRTWIFDVTFLLSRWTCIYGRGCKGVLTEEAPELKIGCCSYGAHFTDKADRKRVEVAALTLTAEQWQFKPEGDTGGVVEKEDGSWRTRLVEDACIFLNRPGFPGGIGCSLHKAALDRGERPLDLKPDVCWQLPLRRIDATDEVGHVTSTVREWKRRDWGEGGQEFAWWCTEAPEAFVGETTVLHSMGDELVEMVGAEIHARLLTALTERASAPALLPHPTVRKKPRRR
jgi:hypothetical protein